MGEAKSRKEAALAAGAVPRSHRRAAWFAAGIAAAFLVAIVRWGLEPPAPPAGAPPPAGPPPSAPAAQAPEALAGAPGVAPTQPVAAPPPSAAPAPEVLAGRWLRPDGGYVLTIRSAGPDGRLEASYLNPNPINVSRAEWHREGDVLHVFVELRDVNYPGSTYTLRYYAGADRLTGVYYQAALDESYDIEFLRLPE